MTNRLKSTLLSIVLAALVAAPAQSQAHDSSKPKLVLFITVDATRPDYLSRFEEFARVVDIAPTLAAIVHAAPQEKLDGHVLQNAIR
jgi:hypothetical protein